MSFVYTTTIYGNYIQIHSISAGANNVDRLNS